MLKVRDRDGLVTREGIIFRVLGYDHPPNACFCDVEYAPATVFVSEDPRAVRSGGEELYYKFYGDEGLRFVADKYPQYMVLHEAMNTYLVGLHEEQVAEVRRPDEKLAKIVEEGAVDPLLKVLLNVLETVTSITSLTSKDFGVFGSILHSFHSVDYSDLDFVVYGRAQLRELLEGLKELYDDPSTGFRNEYASSASPDSRYRHFHDYSLDEYLWHQRRKLIYAVYERAWRPIKIEFEPVKRWDEISNEYPHVRSIRKLGMVEATVEVIDDSESAFMPSKYSVEVLEASRGVALEVERVVSYIEEFRMQLRRGEKGFVRGWLERVEKKDGSYFYQITLTYTKARYSDQVLKAAKLSAT